MNRRTGWWRNPLFRHELARPCHRRWALRLGLLNSLYLAFYWLARVEWHAYRAPGALESTLIADFPYRIWLVAAGLLLSLSVHWLVPPLLLGLLGRSYDLRLLELIVRGGFRGKDALAGQIAGTLAPLLFGALPLGLLLPSLAISGAHYLILAAGGLVCGLLWSALSSGATFWSGVALRSQAQAVCGSYLLTTILLPLVLGLAAAAVGLGCSAGRRDAAVVFPVATMLTWGMLVLGLAATFWDATFGRLFPESRQPLWMEPDPSSTCPER